VTSTLTVEMLPARNGDALWISYGDSRHILVDCGHVGKAAVARRIIDSGRVELFIVTHMDGDHVGDAIPLLKNPNCAARIGDV
jgi:glyoxylase-like metal-dependent hydrolase (beta-lactamase superfamily II)